MDKYHIQQATEVRLSKQSIHARLEASIDRDEDLKEAMFEASTAVYRWIDKTNVGLGEEPSVLVNEAMLIILKLLDRRELLGAVAGQLAKHIPLEDRLEAIKYANEILVVMCDSGLFDLEQVEYLEETEAGTMQHEYWYISNPWQVEKPIEDLIYDSMYLPPMLVEPQRLRHNNQPYTLTGERKSLILGKFNSHDGDICLDALNIASSVELSLNEQMLNDLKLNLIIPLKVQVRIKEDPKRKEQFEQFMRESASVYKYLLDNGNKFYLGQRPDKRGRMYSQGYHCNTQSDVFRKSIIEFSTKEIIEGF